MTKLYDVTFYFTSGESMNVNYTPEQFTELKEYLRNAWTTVTVSNDQWGINCAQVTHYKVYEIN